MQIFILLDGIQARRPQWNVTTNQNRSLKVMILKFYVDLYQYEHKSNARKDSSYIIIFELQ